MYYICLSLRLLQDISFLQRFPITEANFSHSFFDSDYEYPYVYSWIINLQTPCADSPVPQIFGELAKA